MRFFMSSTYEDLKEIRAAAINVLEGITGHVTDATGQVIAMEFFNATERTCKEECLHELESSDVVIGIYGNRYGYCENGTPPSMTEIEFDYAVAQNKPILAFVLRPQNREEWQTVFIREKVHGRGYSCANFTSVEDFVPRLNESLKNYLGSYDGYSLDSLWTNVCNLKSEIMRGIHTDSPDYYLQMEPYGSGQEDDALDAIITSAQAIHSFIPDLSAENHAVLAYAHQAMYSDTQPSDEDRNSLCSSVTLHSQIISRNWELINLGLHNHSTRILLAAMYLKLVRMQNRLLHEPWTEDLRQQVIAIRESYLKLIPQSHYVD
jgi:hypothetical protein